MLHFRKPVERLGVAPLTSMFWYGENGPPPIHDWRPEIHDSDGLAISTGAGERIWRPLVVDFQGGPLASLGRASGVQPVVSVARGRIEGVGAYPVVGTDLWRLMVDVTVLDPDSADLRAYLRRGGGALSETWTYQLFNR